MLKKKSKFREFLTALALITASAVVALLLAELFLAIFLPQERSTPYAMIHTDLGSYGTIHGWPAYSKIWHKSPDFSVTYQTNKFGFRGKDHAFEKPPGVYRVVVLGDSFVFGYGVKEDQVFTRVLEKKLNTEGHGRFEFVNLGASGTGLAIYQYIYKKLGHRYDPDMVMVVFFQNDLDYDIINPDAFKERGATHAGDEKRSTHVQRVRNFFRSFPGYIWLCENSHLWAWMRRSLSERFLAVQIRERNASLGVAPGDEAARRKALQERAVKTYEWFAEQTCPSGKRLAAVTANDWTSRFPVLDSALKKLAAENDCVDYVTLDTPQSMAISKRDYHWSPDGHASVAEQLDSALGPAFQAGPGPRKAPVRPAAHQ